MEGVSSIKYDEDVFGWWGNRYNNNVALFIGDGRWSGHTVRDCSRSIGRSPSMVRTNGQMQANH